MKREKKSTEKSVIPQSSEPDSELVPSDNSNDTNPSNNGEKTMSKKFDFTSLVAAEKKQSVDDLAEYQVVLREIARDECDRPQAEILRLLERCERDTSDLQSDVEWRVKRDEQIAEVKRAEEYAKRNVELLDQLKSMRGEFEKVQSEYNAKRYPIIAESDALDSKLRTIERYRDDLYDSCRDTNLKLELKSLESSFDRYTESTLYKRQEQINSEIRQLQYKLGNVPIMPNRPERIKELKREIKELQEEWQKLELKKTEIAQKKIEHQQAVDAIREKMIFS